MADGIAAHILTWNSREFLGACLDGLKRQSTPPDRILFIDCGSTDGTREWLETRRIRGIPPAFDILALPDNLGYSGGHNAGLERNRGLEHVLLMNPDVRLQRDFISVALDTLRRHPGAGALSGKLLRGDDGLTSVPGPIIDSTGMVMTRNQRHLDRGAGEMDRGQYDLEQEVFGVSGAAAVYRRSMLDDIAIDGEIFDESFFAYREDADLAWRARLLGWSAVYAPGARAVHRRRVRPGQRRELPAELNRYSVRNRFLLRMKNQTAGNLWHTLLPGLRRDLAVIGYVLAREHSSVPGLLDVVRLRRETWRKRKAIMARRRASSRDVDRWFGAPRGGY